MTIKNTKPLGIKNYGSIAHLPNSRMGAGDHHCDKGQARIATEKARDRHDLIIVQEKLDGCLSYRTMILTDEGRIPIGKIVNQKLPVKVASFNIELGVVEYKPITAYFKQKRKSNWVKVIVKSKKRGDPTRHVVCTDNHNFYTSEGWMEAKDLNPGQIVYQFSDRLGTETEQAILGGLLGDSSILQPNKTLNRRGFCFSHSTPQSGYFDFKLSLFGNIAKEVKGQKGGYPGSQFNRRAISRITPATHELITKYCVVGEKKQITEHWANALTPLALAVWYMDDGSCQMTDAQRPRAHFATNGFSFSEVDILVNSLKRRFGIAGEVFDYKGATVVLTREATEKLFDLIYPFVPACMKYKLPVKYHKRPCVLEGTGELAVYEGCLATEVIKVDREKIKVWECEAYQFDITVADNHNYFAGEILVHNSNVGVARVDGAIYPLSRAGYLADTSKYRQHWEFSRWVYANQDRFLAVLQDGERLVGEWLMQAHGTRYALKHEPFVAFDLMRGIERTVYSEFVSRVAIGEFVTPYLIHSGAPISVEDVLRKLNNYGFHGALDTVEGAVWRVERNELINKGKGGMRRWQVDFLVKFVRSDKQDGIYLADVSGKEDVWNWQPNY